MLDHFALITKDMRRSADFYCRWFQGTPSFWGLGSDHPLCFIDFGGRARLEIMERHDPAEHAGREEQLGFVHIAFGFETKKELRELTAQMEEAGVTKVGGPIMYGNNEFYESSFLDPDGNLVELSVFPDCLDRD